MLLRGEEKAIPLAPIRARSRTEKRCGGAPCSARRRDAGVVLAPFYAEPPAHAELLLGYAALDEAQIRAGIRELRRALDGLRTGRHAESGSPPGS